MYNVEGKIGGDAELSPQGRKYAAALPSLIIDNVGDAPLTVRPQFLTPRLFRSCHPAYYADDIFFACLV
jgi:hypothetical protein